MEKSIHRHAVQHQSQRGQRSDAGHPSISHRGHAQCAGASPATTAQHSAAFGAAQRGVWCRKGPFAAQMFLCWRWEGASGGSRSGHGAAGTQRSPTSCLWRQTGK